MKKKIPKDIERKLVMIEKIQSKGLSKHRLFMNSLFYNYKIFSFQHLDAINTMMNSTIKYQNVISSLANPLSGVMTNVLQDTMKHQDVMSKLTSSIPDVIASIESQMSMFNSISPDSLGLNLYSANLEQYQNIVEQASKIADKTIMSLPSFNHMINLPTFCLDTIFSKNPKLFSDPNLFGFSNRLMNIQRSYADFYKDSIDRIVETNDEKITESILRSIEISNNQFVDSIELLELTLPENSTDEAVPEETDLNLQSYQQDEIIKNVSVAGETNLRSKDISEIITQSLLLFLKCCDSYSLNNITIFRSSQKSCAGFAELNTIICVDERSFGQFIDYLYFIFYEGAGSYHLRYHTENKGPMHIDDCNFIMRVKFIRNHWLRHDVERGGGTKSKKKNLFDTLNYYGFDNMPMSEDEYITLQENIINDLQEFIEILKQKI